MHIVANFWVNRLAYDLNGSTKDGGWNHRLNGKALWTMRMTAQACSRDDAQSLYKEPDSSGTLTMKMSLVFY